MKMALQLIFGVSCLGLIFSGVLSYQELFGASVVSCPAPGAPGTIFGYPACVYGFFLFIVLAVIAGLGLTSRR